MTFTLGVRIVSAESFAGSALILLLHSALYEGTLEKFTCFHNRNMFPDAYIKYHSMIVKLTQQSFPDRKKKNFLLAWRYSIMNAHINFPNVRCRKTFCTAAA